MKYLLQAGNWMQKEKRTITLSDYPYMLCLYENLNTPPKDDYIPIGTVEYIQRFAEISNIILPPNISYPRQLQKYLKRSIWLDTFQNVDPSLFVKPIRTKVFTGAIKSNITENVHPNTSVWVSEPINLINEYRFYIIDKTIVGYSRYDDNDNPDESIDITSIHQMINDYTEAPIGYSIDIGITDNQETILIECNDGYALGLYPWGNMTNEKYVELITKRWNEILHIVCDQQ